MKRSNVHHQMMLLPGVLIALLCLSVLRLHIERRKWRKSEQLRHALLCSLPGYVALVDQQGRVLDVNRAWHDLESSHPLSRVNVGDHWLEACSFGAAQVERILAGRSNHESTEITVGGVAEYYLALQVRRLQWPDGGAVLLFMDCGHRHHDEQKHHNADERLVHTDRLAIVGKFSSVLAHELKQPLTSIHTNARVALKLLRKEVPDMVQAAAALEDIFSDSERATVTIEHLRSLIRRGEVSRVAHDLNTVVRTAVNLLEPAARMRQVTLIVQLNPASVHVVVDAVQIQQILLNLVSNAFDAVETQPRNRRCVTISVLEFDKAYAEVSVHDTGKGLDTGNFEQVFEPFFTTKQSGLGLGLPICRTIAEAHGGRLFAESNNEGGATFRLRLPLA